MSRKDNNFDSDEKKYEYVPPESAQKQEEPKAKKEGSHTPHYVIFAGVFIVGIIIGAIATPSFTGGVTAAPASSQGIGPEAASQKIIEYFELNPLVDSAKYTGEGDSGDYYYEVNIEVDAEDETQTIPIMVSLDGNEVIQTSSIDNMIAQLQTALDQEAAAAQAASGPEKSDKPVVDVFIMSYCPYGLQMQKAALPVMELLGDDAEISIKWVDYIMHGEKEINENTLQYCIQEEEPEKYIAYATCFTKKGDAEECKEFAELDMEVIDACIGQADEDYNISGLYADQSTWSGGRYPPYMINSAENSLYGVQGSPTVVINGAKVSVSRSPEMFKQAVCDAFNTPPEECSTELSSDPASSGFGGNVGTTSEAQCG